ncbi:MAG: ribbon-helix-helix domain-containing protein [Bacteroidales bacterium]|nr:ribbon-helix-helix domain-containing protein [Bacteroidales bacterium]
MTTFTSTLPDEIIKQLNEMSGKLAIPKNKIIEKALKIYLDQLVRAEYIKSYSTALEDQDILTIAEEGMADYLKQLEDETM